jgi:hypothetical protein
LEADAERFAKFILRYLLLDQAKPDAPAKFNVVRTARPLIFAQCVFPRHRPTPKPE